MIRRFILFVLALLALFAQPAIIAAAPAAPLVRLQTSAGAIVIRLDTKRAPVTAANFLRYVDAKRFDGTTFYRAARNRKNAKFGLVQGGINHKVVRAFNPIPHEPTSRTGLRHIDGTISMARNAPGSAMGDFFFTLGAMPYLDARAGSPGYAAFGQVVEGKAVLQKILAGATHPGGWSVETKGQSLVAPIRIISARRVS